MRLIEELGPDNPLPTLEEEALTPFEQEIKAHWEQHHPVLCRQLKAKGKDALEMSVRRAGARQEYQIGLLLARNPGMHRMQAEDLTQEELWNLWR